MTGSVALDVVIGLVFIYLLYSLLASIVQEMIASFLGLRARNLYQAISRMLENDPEDKSKTKIVKIYKDLTIDVRQSYFRIFPKKGDNLFKRFYKQPSIKYLASGRFFSKPSYISDTNFSKAVIDILKEGGSEADVLKKIKENLSNDETSLINGDTAKHISSLLDDAGTDLEKFKASLEDWFNNTMDRAAGWFKRTTQLTLFIIGFVIAALFNVNTIETVKLLANDSDARENMVDLASAYAAENDEVIQWYQERKNDTVPDTLNQTKLDKLNNLLEIKGVLDADIKNVAHIMGFQPEDSLLAHPIKMNSLSTDEKSLFRELQIDNASYKVDFPSAYLANNTEKYYDAIDPAAKINGKLYVKFNHFGFFWDNLWGYLITALAISLGASFWFDLLNKLVKMRSSIKQKTTDPTATGDASQDNKA